ncbi:MAG: hypothetical protein ACI9BW_001516 [Gammaproteobacteria bacterium]|jgi:hypothetical protein
MARFSNAIELCERKVTMSADSVTEDTFLLEDLS